MQMSLPGLALSPGLELVHRISDWIEVVMPGDLGQLSLVQHAILLVLQGPGLKFRLRTKTGRSSHRNFISFSLSSWAKFQ